MVAAAATTTGRTHKPLYPCKRETEIVPTSTTVMLAVVVPIPTNPQAPKKGKKMLLPMLLNCIFQAPKRHLPHPPNRRFGA